MRLSLSGHLVHTRRAGLVSWTVLAAALQLAAVLGLTYVVGWHAIRGALEHFDWVWLPVVAAALAVAFVGYYFGYRGIYRVDDGPQLSPAQLRAVVAAGFGGFLAHSGSALDDYALRAAGADRREAKVRVVALAGLEHGVLALGGCAAGIAVLSQGLSRPPADFSTPWAVIPVPGFLLAFWLANRYRDRLRGRAGWRDQLGIFLDSIYLIRMMFRHPVRRGAALGGMALFWAADIFAAWAGLATFGFRMGWAGFVVGFATGLVYTRRTGPLGGAGVLGLVLPVTVWYSGAPFATAIAGIFCYRVLSVWLPFPFSLASLPRLRRMGEAGVPEDFVQQPALRRTPEGS